MKRLRIILTLGQRKRIADSLSSAATFVLTAVVIGQFLAAKFSALGILNGILAYIGFMVASLTVDRGDKT